MEIETTNEAHPVLENVECCKKNPNHEEFYDISQLSLDILPEDMRNDKWLSYIRNISETVVRLSVEKPDGTCMFGSGFVCKSRLPDDTLYIRTNHHVIGSQDDVKNCTIDFFYNSTDMKGVETSRGVKMVYCDEEWDICTFTFNPIPQKLKQLMLNPIVKPPMSDSVIVISHPHGGPKKLTVGEHLTSERDDVTKYIHTARTCPGSSGGRVINSWDITDWKFNMFTNIHCAGRRCDVYNGESVETSNVNQFVWP